MIAVIDSNVFVSEVLWGGVPARVVEMAKAGVFQAVTSPDLLRELRRALREKLGVPESRCEAVEKDILRYAGVVLPEENLGVPVRDPGDIRVIACAVAAHADFIVTGDRDLLVLREVRGARIVTPREFLDLLSESW
jgi:uncharacterized protein